MKKTVTVIVIAFSIGILMSCNSENKEAENQTAPAESSAKTEVQIPPAPAVAEEEKEAHQVDKPGDGAHKGIVEEAGEKNHIEMVMAGNDVSFYPCDDKTNPIDTKGWTGKAVFKYKGGSSKTFDLMLMDGALTAMGANSGKSFTATATLMMDKTSISADFNSEGSMEKH